MSDTPKCGWDPGTRMFMCGADDLKRELSVAQTRVAELERDLLFANDAAAKGDLARANAGGMELRIAELEMELLESQAEEGSKNSECDSLAIKLGRLQADNERLRKDAERYRYFRAHNQTWNAVDLDNQLDAALAQPGSGE